MKFKEENTTLIDQWCFYKGNYRLKIHRWKRGHLSDVPGKWHIALTRDGVTIERPAKEYIHLDSAKKAATKFWNKCIQGLIKDNDATIKHLAKKRCELERLIL